MVYSVWDNINRKYDYYKDAVVNTDTHSPKPKHLKATKMGLTPEQASWPLPPTAKKIGSGQAGALQISSRKSVGTKKGLDDFELPPFRGINIALYGAAGYLTYKTLPKNLALAGILGVLALKAYK